MKVWVIAPDYGHDGYGEPWAAFTTKEAADASHDKNSHCELFEVDLDPPLQSGSIGKKDHVHAL